VTSSVAPDPLRAEGADPPESPATAFGGRPQLIDDLAEALRLGNPDALLAIVFFEASPVRRAGAATASVGGCSSPALRLSHRARAHGDLLPGCAKAEFEALIRAQDQANRPLVQIEGEKSERRVALASGASVLPREAGEPVEALGLPGERQTDSRRGRKARESDAIGPARTAQAG
jgi:hypothetical protein